MASAFTKAVIIAFVGKAIIARITTTAINDMNVEERPCSNAINALTKLNIWAV